LIDKAGRHLYAANRNHDSIATFTIAADGSIKRIANTHTEGTIPRSLTLDPTGKFLYSLNQRADNVATFRLDSNGCAEIHRQVPGRRRAGDHGVFAVGSIGPAGHVASLHGRQR
jgi:6-phosphogluconolactonase (cycloisomerase 2 family)